jgi:signal transduction histidine kinase
MRSWRILSSKSRAISDAFIRELPARALGILDLPRRKSFMEEEIRRVFDFRRVEILVKPEGPERFSAESTRVRDLMSRVIGILEGTQKPFLNQAVGTELGVAAILGPLGGTYAYLIRRGETNLGILVIDSTPRTRLDSLLERTLLTLTKQLALVLENSQLLKAKLELQHALAQQAQMAQLGEMTARIAHEIKNPLSSIKTIVQIMQEDRDFGEKFTPDLQLIDTEIDRLGSSVAQLLNFARPSPKVDEQVQLRDAADAALAVLRQDIKQAKARADNEIPEDICPVVGNSAVYREIFLNLIVNALQAGGEGVGIWFRAWEGVLEDGSESYVLLVVEDDGPGVAPEVQAQVFTPFFTTKQIGTGLGLAIVKRNVEHMGGQITLESPAREERGTRFLIHLPTA